MIKVEHIEVFNFEGAIRGLRNPMNSWDKSDSDVAFHALQNFFDNNPMADKYREWNDNYGLNIQIGPNDLDLMRRLYKAGKEHRKYLRQIFVSMDITAPLYYFKELDTYKIGTTTNSCSTMHTIHKKEFELSDFSHEHLDGEMVSVNTYNEQYASWDILMLTIKALNWNREKYIETKDKKYWWNMIQLLPSSYNQKRTWTGSYENLISMYHQRKGHKLDEWRDFCDVILTLPYIKEIIGIKDIDDVIHKS